MSNGQPPTMKDVARHAGVSVSTVSYVLNDSGPVAPARRARVLDAVRVLNYAPNEAARGLKRRSAPTIGLVVPELSNQFFALLVEGVEQAAAARGVLVVLCAPEATDGGESLNGRLLRSQRLNGIIYLSGASTSPTSLLELTRLGPIVLVDEQVPGFDLPAIVSDNRRGAREVGQHVLEAGHRKIAVIGGPEGLWTSQQRLAGYREALAAAGIEPDTVPIFGGNYRQESGTELAAKALSGPPSARPTALLCANDLMAIGVLEYCRSEGIRVPEELSVVGFDDLPMVSLLTPRLTTVRQPARDMGERAANLLFELIEDKVDVPAPEPFPTLLQIRDSVATPLGSS
ncbi:MULTISPECIES: LacI family DNA-binding transcriptional regulator [unclassified Rhodococcus (in: high G+C Gram-positive bacteria)]|uniref:LacI family DNA-binding transcriptional regulator n=1 Tax=unclassified Rhodococcus (in: high G+C Gram-positive bacteria) TaxID=192944 RepID=UPI002078DA77|nr:MULTISPECIES: LacI family DNA-binding transcriptional regulator [unclassified Rhodococcus (in: high G+C Gram-positive bacteria)]